MTEERQQEKYEPSELTPLGQKIFDFCQKNPAVVFNNPPDYQEEFKKEYREEMKDPRSVGYVEFSKIFFENKLLKNFFDKIEAGTRLLMLISAWGKLITVVAKLEYLYKCVDIPVNHRVDLFMPKSFIRHFGYGGLWFNFIQAVAVVDGLTKEMAVLDPEAEIFMKKAGKYAISFEEYCLKNLKIEVMRVGGFYEMIKDGAFRKDQLFRIIKIFGGKITLPFGGEIHSGEIVSGDFLASLIKADFTGNNISIKYLEGEKCRRF